MSQRRVLSVGQCDLDHGNISRALRDRYQIAGRLVPPASAGTLLDQERNGPRDAARRVRTTDGDDGARARGTTTTRRRPQPPTTEWSSCRSRGRNLEATKHHS